MEVWGWSRLDPNGFDFAAPERERGGTHAHDERIAARHGLRDHFDVLAVHEPELDQAALHGGECAIAATHADDRRGGAGRQHAQRRGIEGGHSGVGGRWRP